MGDNLRWSMLAPPSDIPSRLAVWLRPEPCAATELFASKLGGVFPWHPGIMWPRCGDIDVSNDFGRAPSHNDYFVPLAQFRREEYPELPFPAGADLLQLLWCPRYHGDYEHRITILQPPIARAYWHAAAGLQAISNPRAASPDRFLLPQACRFRPLRWQDEPQYLELSPQQQAERSKSWPNPVCEPPMPGTKLLGFPRWDKYPDVPQCPLCEQEMDLLFTISTLEVEPAQRFWYELYDVSGHLRGQLILPTGVEIMDTGRVFLFYCFRCGGDLIVTRMI